ncbi:MAG: amidinotransferase [Chloroflexi bacterium]|nr:amidinotransferase [Chloroflexota bacterium]
MTSYGCQSNVGEIKGVLLKRPQEAYISQASVSAQWRELNYFGEPDFHVAAAQHEQLVTLLSRVGAEITYLPTNDGVTLDSVYVHDPVIVSNRGAVLCNMGKVARRNEPEAAGKFFEQIGVPILGRVTGEGLLEGGDVIWVDERTVAVGEGYRTNAEGIRQLRTLLGDLVDEVIAVPLPHWTGPADCLHLMSNISPIDHDLAVVYSRLLPVPFRQWLIKRGVKLVEVPDEEYDSMACNVLAVAPRKAIMIAGNPITRARLEAEGVEVWTYDGSDISIKGAGGPTCLTRPFWRG